MTQVYKEDVWHANTEKIRTDRNMSIRGKKYSKAKIISNKKKHEFWSNTYRRKRQMSEFFSDSAFGSQSDTLILWVRGRIIPGLEDKYRVRRVIDAHDYREPPDPDDNRLAFMRDPEG